MLLSYLKITKPEIILVNIFSTISGFLLGSQGDINYKNFFFTLTSTSLIIASGCVFNNYIDRDIDAKMNRTKNRILVKKKIDPKNSLIYAIILGILGFFELYLTSNKITFFIALTGFIIYVYFYSICLKRFSEYSMLVGSLSGAIPPIIGYCAATNCIDLAVLLLLIIFIFWQIPHFYAISIFRIKEYKYALIPTLPIKYGIKYTQKKIISCIIIFILMTILLKLFGYTGYKYLIVTTVTNIYWLNIAIKSYFKNDNYIIVKNTFIFSIISIIVFCIMVSIDVNY